MIDRAQQAADAIDAVATLTPHQARSVLNEYTKDDLIAAIATGHGGGSPVLCHQAILDSTHFPVGNEIVPLGLDLAVGDRVINIGLACSSDLSASDFYFGKDDISGTNKLCGLLLNGNDPDDGGPYSGATGAGHSFDLAEAEAYDGQGRLPALVKVAHELKVTNADPISAGEATVSVYVIRAAQVATLAPPTAPEITSLTPTSGPVGTPVVIAGSGFTGATALTCVTVPMVFTVDSDIQISSTIPVGAPEAPDVIRVTVNGAVSGDGASSIFTVTP